MTQQIGKPPLRIAVLSDLHAYQKSDAPDAEQPSFLCVSSPRDIPALNPVSGVLKLIADSSLEADLLLCPGDLGDKANPAGIDCGWRAVQEIKTALKAAHAIGTVGNHDIDSRYNQNDPDPKGFLQSLNPPFPLPIEGLNDRFWSRNYALFETDVARVVCLNSSAFHGGKNGESAHGRISERTLTGLKAELLRCQAKPVNILLCHHHPHKHSEVTFRTEYDEMAGGQSLLDLLGSGTVGEWLVVHGHKHHPKLQYAAGTQTAPVVFSAGSLCARLYAELGTAARNQFYILTLPYDSFHQTGLVGRFEAWDWTTGSGWQRARQGSGLPHRGGFGFRGGLPAIASQISSFVNSPMKKWAELEEAIPDVKYVLPDFLRLLIQKLGSDFHLQVSHDSDGNPEAIGRAT